MYKKYLLKKNLKYLKEKHINFNSSKVKKESFKDSIAKMKAIRMIEGFIDSGQVEPQIIKLQIWENRKNFK